HTPYVRPCENGSHSGVFWVQFNDGRWRTTIDDRKVAKVDIAAHNNANCHVPASLHEDSRLVITSSQPPCSLHKLWEQFEETEDSDLPQSPSVMIGRTPTGC